MYVSRFVSVGGVDFHHLEWSGGDPVVVFLPGFINNAYSGVLLGRLFSPERRVLSFDLRGRGKSDKPFGEYGFFQHVVDVQARLEVLGVGKVVLVGHSYGAMLALYLAAYSSLDIDSVILFDGGVLPSGGAFRLFRAYYENLRYEYASVEEYVAPYRGMITMQPWSDDAEVMVSENVFLGDDGIVKRVVPSYVVRAELGSFGSFLQLDLQDLYMAVSVRCLLVRAGLGSFGVEDRHIGDLELSRMGELDLTVFEMSLVGHTGVLVVSSFERDAVLRSFLGL